MGHIVTNTNECCGCGACEAVCPSGAIRMEKKEAGHRYPIVRPKLCIDCGKCLEVCQIGNVVINSTTRQKYYAAQHRNKKIRMASSSGGVFYALAERVIRDGGVVCGVYFDQDWNVRHGIATNVEELARMCGSKYVQSDCRRMYKKIGRYLNDDKTVLFSGTPCQCQAVLKYVKSRKIVTDRLYLVDFVCHGVGSPVVWKQYVKWLEKHEGKMRSFTFRDKENGWENFRSKAINVDGMEMIGTNSSYFDMYSTLFITRDSCFQCVYTSYERCSDLTLGDFWNIGTFENKFDIQSGVSQILSNTDKGEELLGKISEKLLLSECTASDCWQPHLEYSIKIPAGRRNFLKYYNNHTFAETFRKYGKGTWTARCIKCAVRLVRKLGLYALAGKAYHKISCFGKNHG